MSVCQAAVAIGLFRLPANLAPNMDGGGMKSQIQLITETLKRLFSNRVLMFDTVAMVFVLFSNTNNTYMAKFIEFQFHVTPSQASLVSGSSKMIGHIVALSISTLVVTWFKPSARSLSLYNFVADSLAVIISISMIFIDCPNLGDLQTPANCLSSCSCPPTMAPVCHLATMTTFTSACAAGCTSTNATLMTFTDCGCAPDPIGALVPGFCPGDCSSSLYYFMSITFILTFIMTLGRVSLVINIVNCIIYIVFTGWKPVGAHSLC